ncbi:MAG: hypothetical protein IPL59_07310 [Candidatus Competibacteraceae bacterium]|uniref:Uncharacterized protein n=1 Tax=Candidatus Contendobacter odensis Run_B_J11 TaxID=1400861 RepID=A0A7U7GD16_9GAMM|nr:hypothetical protein [Candidatus Contendobacter odensis]MBK8534941.1 hypothetical protein [Candidatus Competibacteraceae bacterium]CDH46090.1 hypothetical protein BN874_340050 [Candidatus Contendobacter odensis Run_B_J11]
MQLNKIYAKTAKGLEEIQTRIHKLPANLRRLLIMVDGHSTAAEMINRLTTLGEVELALDQLATGGFIAVPASKSAAPDPAAPPAPPEFDLDQAKSLIHSILLAAMGPTAAHRIECVEATTTPEQLRIELEVIRDILSKVLSQSQAEQVWQQLAPIMPPLEQPASIPTQSTTPVATAVPTFNLDKAKGFIRSILLGAMGPTAARRIERIEATTTPEHLRVELDAIRDMLPKVISKRQAEQTWRQLEPIMISLGAPAPAPDAKTSASAPVPVVPHTYIGP